MVYHVKASREGTNAYACCGKKNGENMIEQSPFQNDVNLDPILFIGGGEGEILCISYFVALNIILSQVDGTQIIKVVLVQLQSLPTVCLQINTLNTISS